MKRNNILVKIFSLLTSIVDYRNKKKIIFFFKKRFKNNYLDIIDIGAHKGETIDLLIKNFNINKIYSFEPNSNLYLNLTEKINNLSENIILFKLGGSET